MIIYENGIRIEDWIGMLRLGIDRDTKEPVTPLLALFTPYSPLIRPLFAPYYPLCLKKLLLT